MPVDPQTLRVTMRKWSTGVTIVTTALGDTRAGMTVSSFTSVSLEPPTVLVCLNKGTFTHEMVGRSGVFAISMLGTGQAWLSQRFAGFDPNVTDRFAGLDLATAETGSPLIPGAIAWLDCVVIAAHDSNTHTIYVGEVVHAASEPDRSPLVYHNRAYHALGAVEKP